MSPVTLMDRSRHVRRSVGACVCRSFVDRWIDRLAMLRAYTSKGSDPELELHDSSVPAPTNEVVGMQSSQSNGPKHTGETIPNDFPPNLRQVWNYSEGRCTPPTARSLANERERASEWHTLFSQRHVCRNGAHRSTGRWLQALQPSRLLLVPRTNLRSRRLAPEAATRFKGACRATTFHSNCQSATPRGQPAGP